MRHKCLSIPLSLVLGGTLFFAASSEAAFQFPGVASQKWRANMQNFDGLVVHDGTTADADGNSISAGTTELFGAFQIQSPLTAQGTVSTPSEFKFGGSSPFSDDVPVPTGEAGTEEVVGLIYDLDVFRQWDDSTSSFVTPGITTLSTDDLLFLRPLGRNPLPEAPGDVPGSGGVVELYSDTDAGNNFAPGNLGGANDPTNWTLGTGGTRDSFGAIGDGTDETLLVSFVLQNLVNSGITSFESPTAGTTAMPTDAVLAFRVTSPFGTGFGQADTQEFYGNLDVVGGTQAGRFVQEGMAVEQGSGNVVGTTDWRVDQQVRQNAAPFNMRASGTSLTGEWDVSSDDPVEFVTTPAPASIVIWALIGVCGVSVALRRRYR